MLDFDDIQHILLTRAPALNGRYRRNGSYMAYRRLAEHVGKFLLWPPPNEQRAGEIVMVDSTNFTTLFGGTDSLEFWRNIAAM